MITYDLCPTQLEKHASSHSYRAGYFSNKLEPRIFHFFQLDLLIFKNRCTLVVAVDDSLTSHFYVGRPLKLKGGHPSKSFTARRSKLAAGAGRKAPAETRSLAAVAVVPTAEERRAVGS